LSSIDFGVKTLQKVPRLKLRNFRVARNTLDFIADKGAIGAA
jgi:hypothetical protein